MITALLLLATIRQIDGSGRAVELRPAFQTVDRISPGAPPMLAFRYLDGKLRGRFTGLDLVMDDAGH